MTVTTVPFVQAPPIIAPFGNLLDCATLDPGSIEWLDDGALFDSYNCLHFDAEAEFCAPNTKDFGQSAGWQNSFRFVAVGGVTCQALGLDTPRMKSEVQRVFETSESTAVERGFMKTRFVQAAGGAGVWPAPTDITPAAGAVKPGMGVALLEAYARDNYAGLPTIHVPVVIGSLLLGVQGATLNGKVINTRLGSKLAVGGGYDYPNTGPTGANAATGEKWLYATGEVFLRRGPVDIRQVIDFSSNDVSVMAERIYVGAVDCFAAAVRVQVTS